MDRHLGDGYSRVWAQQQALAGLDGRTVDEALAAGEHPRRVWRVVWASLELPASER